MWLKKAARTLSKELERLYSCFYSKLYTYRSSVISQKDYRRNFLMDKNILETQGLFYSYPDGTQALKDIKIKIKKGKTTAILGGNGSGKSTLFLNMNGILRPPSGKILYNEVSIDYSRKGLLDLRRAAGLVFQDPDNQLFSASVYQDVSFGAVNLKLKEDEIRRRVEI